MEDPEFEHHRVVIAAAVAAIYGARGRVRQIRAVNYPVTSNWARQGRMLVQSSHNLDTRRWAVPGRGRTES
jgi:hypothetical protein